jgi:hypothetical protein
MERRDAFPSVKIAPLKIGNSENVTISSPHIKVCRVGFAQSHPSVGHGKR